MILWLILGQIYLVIVGAYSDHYNSCVYFSALVPVIAVVPKRE